ncbi:hypothetical protein K502DRAFT_109179 [Neoconidiobolus thromboides FSU 785]|nr:hypothetical protein K502DRAFT_109179 [Neoconidiobolus thromboides FSU 785]
MPPEMSTKPSSKNKPPVAASQVNLQKLKGNIFEDAMILKMLQERNYENIELHKTLKLAKENLNKMMVEYSKLKRERDEMFAQASVLQNQYFTLLETSANAMASLNLKVEEVKTLNVKITSLENIKTTLESKVKENQISQAKNSFQVREINRLNKELGEKSCLPSNDPSSHSLSPC